MIRFFISPEMPEQSPVWSVVFGCFQEQRRSIDGTKVLLQLTMADAERFASEEPINGCAFEDIQTFITQNGIIGYTIEEVLPVLQGVEWTDASKFQI